MSIKIIYTKNTVKKTSANMVLFCGEAFNIKNLKNFLSLSEFNYISDILKTSDLKKNLHTFEINSKKKNSISIFKK